MSEAEVSYYDWELSFKKNDKKETNLNNNEKQITSLGITEEEFKNHLRKWKKENL